MSVVEVGQYFVTRNASEFLLRSVACREYTLPRDDPASEPKGWIQGNTRIGPILEVTTSFQHFKFGVEVRIQSMKERQFSLLGQNFLRNHSLCEQLHQVQHPKVLQVHKKRERYQQAQKWLQPDRRQKAKPQPRESSGTTTIPLSERVWIDIVPSKQDLDSHNFVEESDQSSSTQSEITSRARWSSSILQD